jgi:hypothetical protein
MKHHLQDLGIALSLTVWYFAAVYFAASALLPSLAIHIAFWSVVPPLLIYLLMVLTESDKPGVPLFFLFGLPFVCVFAGVLWWGMRILGFWEVP